MLKLADTGINAIQAVVELKNAIGAEAIVALAHTNDLVAQAATLKHK